MTVREPEWLPEDLEAALQWADDKASRCPGCGELRSECMDQRSQWRAVSLRCFACEAREAEARRFAEAQSGAGAGIYIAVERDD